MRVHFREERSKFSRDERPHVLDATVEIDRRDERLVAVRQQRLFAPPACLFFTAAEQQMLTQVEPLGLPRQRGGRDERCLRLGLLPLVELREFPEEHIGDHEPDDGIAEEFHRLVVVHTAADILVRPRGVGGRP